MRRITVRGHVDGLRGYARLTKEIVTRLASNELYPSLVPLAPGTFIPIELRSYVVNSIQPEPHELFIGPAKEPVSAGKTTLYMTMNESTMLSPLSRNYINQAKAVVVPCQWNASCFSANGVVVPIHVVPLGVDRLVFHPQCSRKPDDQVVFGCGGGGESGTARKGLETIIKAFIKAFPTDEKVALHVLTGDTTIKWPKDDRIMRISEEPSDRDLAKWYSFLHAFINIAPGGWELMPLEAMGCATPVIGPVFGGMAEYMSDEVGYPVDYELVPAKGAWSGLGAWCEVSEESLILSMKWVRSDLSTARERGDRAALRSDGFLWSNTVDKLKAVMGRYGMLPDPAPAQKVSVRTETCVVQLGRYGDIINILPILKEMDARGERPVLMVSEGYADIMDGVGYATSHILNRKFEELPEATEIAESVYGNRVIQTQVYGKGHAEPLHCESFNKESWRKARMLDLWGHRGLYFDKRNYERESELSRRVLKYDKPNVLFCLDGHSSPIVEGAQIRHLMETRLSESCNLIDLSTIKAERIYDLVGVMDRADMLLTIDTAILHLAEASNIPVVALTTAKPTLWHGTVPRCNLVANFRYGGDFPLDYESILGAVQSFDRHSPRILHVHLDFPTTKPDALRRINLAWHTWKQQYRHSRWTDCRTFIGQFERKIHDDEVRVLPFIKDMIRSAVERSWCSDDIIVITNADTCFSPFLSRMIHTKLQQVRAFYGFRRDFHYLDKELSQAQISMGHHYPGNDIIGFHVGWWMEHGDTYPDMVLGAEAWDKCMRILISETHPGQNCELPLAIYHERHQSRWEIEKHKLKSQLHNRRLAAEWLKSRSPKRT